MAEITLREYIERIRETLRAGQPAEAVEMCRHALHHYPKCVAIYVLLGQALLEQRDYEQAGEVLSLALSADPENVVAYVGLSKVHEAQHMLNEAIWDMERAFELNPNNVAIREELMRLRGLRDGIGRYRIKLTNGALGRLYAQGDLHTRAIQEFEAVLRQEPARLDMQLALAESLWRDRRPGDAVDLCQQILARAPNCLKATLLLGKIWQEMGMADEGHRLLQLAQNLDPDNEMAQDMFEDQSPLPSRRVKIPLPQPPARPPEVRPTPPEAETQLPAPVPLDVTIPDWMRAELVFGEVLGEEPPGEEPSIAPPPVEAESAPAPLEPGEPPAPPAARPEWMAVPDWMKAAVEEMPWPGEPPAREEKPAPKPEAPPSAAPPPKPPPVSEEGPVKVISAFLRPEEFRGRLETMLSEAGVEEGELPVDDLYQQARAELAEEMHPPAAAPEPPLGAVWSQPETFEPGEVPVWLDESVPLEEAVAALKGPEPPPPPPPAEPTWTPPPWLTGEWKPAAEEPPTPAMAPMPPGAERAWTPPAWLAAAPLPTEAAAPAGEEPAGMPGPVEELPAPEQAVVPPTEGEAWTPPPWLAAAPLPTEAAAPAGETVSPEEPPAAPAEEKVWTPPAWLTAEPVPPGAALPAEAPTLAEAVTPMEEPIPAPSAPQAGEQFAPLEPVAVPARQRLAPDVLQDYVEGLLVEPNDYYARLIVASAYQEAGKYNLALEHYEIIIQSAPSLPEQVVTNLEDLVRVWPRSEAAHRLLGDAYLKQGRYDEATAQYNQALELQ